MTRREFVQLSGAAGVSAILWMGEAHAQSSGATPRVRPDVGKLGPSHPVIISYAKAVDAMGKLPSSDPRNWERQARIHLDHCPHGNWFFLPWHRAYLYYFEQICRQLSGDAGFVLPYWNWSQDSQIPAPFWVANSPLNHQRAIGPNDPMSAEFVAQSVIDQIKRQTDFEQFASGRATAQRGGGGSTGDFEGTPHNYVHGRVGRDMGTYMSPRDPIFWLHHANIDRIWAEWNQAGNPNTNDATWTNYTNAQNFVDATGAGKAFVVKETFTTYQLGYRYDTQSPTRPPVAAVRPFSRVANMALTGQARLATRTNAPASLTLQAPPDFLSLARTIATAPPPERRSRRIQLQISNVEPPTNASTFVRVFLNCDYLSQNTPINDPHYVGSFSFFVDQRDGHPHMPEGGLSFSFDITNTLDRLQRSQRFPDDKIVPQILAIAPDGAGDGRTEVKAAKFDVTILEAKK